MLRHTRTGLVGLWAALLVVLSGLTAIATPGGTDDPAALEEVPSIAASGAFDAARGEWGLEHFDFEEQVEYQIDFRGNFDFLSDEPGYLGEVLRERPDGVKNRSLSELGLILTDEEWSEFERREDLVALIGSIRSTVASSVDFDDEEAFTFGEQFAGIWQDQQDGGKLKLYVTSLGAVDTAALFDMVPRGNLDLTIEEAKYSFDELLGFHETAGAVIAKRAIEYESVTIDVEANAVLVTANEKFAVDGIPADALLFESIPEDVLSASEIGGVTYGHNTANQQSGLQIGVYNDARTVGLGCTWGFTGHTPSYNYVITGGHCVPDGAGKTSWTGYSDWAQDADSATRVWRGNHAYTYSKDSARYDAARILSSHADTNCYHSGGSDCGFQITQRLSLYGHTVGQTVCASLGKSNTYRCGTVTAWPFTGNLGGTSGLVENRVEVGGMKAIKGDSGAGAKYANIAHGIISDSNEVDIVYFVPAYYVKSQLGFDFNCVRTATHWAACPVVQ